MTLSFCWLSCLHSIPPGWFGRRSGNFLASSLQKRPRNWGSISCPSWLGEIPPHSSLNSGAILLVEKILHHFGCPKCCFYLIIKAVSGIASGAGFFPSTVLSIVHDFILFFSLKIAEPFDSQRSESWKSPLLKAMFKDNCGSECINNSLLVVCPYF